MNLRAASNDFRSESWEHDSTWTSHPDGNAKERHQARSQTAGAPGGESRGSNQAALSVDAVIAMQSFRYVYDGASRPALHELTFRVNRGEIFGFLGPSGAGKSTTQNALIGLLTGYEGAISVMGRDLRHWSRDYYQRIGVAFEAPNHYLKLTARENLRLFAALYEKPSDDPEHLLGQVGLALDADKRVAEFSKGMRGRLTLARALQHRPELLFLDEPTAGLDPSTARLVRHVIQEART